METAQAITPSATPSTETVPSGPVATTSSRGPAVTGKPAEAKPATTDTAQPLAAAAAATAPKDEKASPKLQVLIQREKAALERERTAKTLEEKISAREAAIAAREAKVAEFENLKTTNPLKALELLGLSYKELTEIQLNDGAVTPDVHVKRVEEKIDSFLTEQQKKEKAQADAAAAQARAQEQQAIEEFANEIGSFVDQNAKEFEYTAFEGDVGKNLILQVIDEHYNRTLDPKTGVGKIMSIKEAATKVEAYLEKKYEPFFGLEKVKPKLLPQKPTAAKPQTTPGQKPTTMSNTMSATPSRPRATLRTDDERVRDAIQWLETQRAARR